MDATEETVGPAERLVPPLDTGQRAFRIALAVAFLIHAAFLIQIGRAVPRAIGDPGGQPDAIAVDLVSAADLKSREQFALPPPGASPVAPSPPPAPQTPPPEPAPAESTPPEPVVEPRPVEPEPAPPPAEKAPEVPKPEAETKPPEPPKPEAKEVEPEKSKLQDFESSLPDLATLPMPSEKDEAAEPPKPEQEVPEAKEEAKEEPKPKEEAQPQEKQDKKRPEPAKKKTAALDMRPPSQQELADAPAGRSAAATRPPGITRSGENDAFGRAVIVALRGTMPPPRGVLGSVIVRLILNENGDLADVKVLQPSGRPGLDESVVFATKQTYFPLPPYKSTVADRTFTIRYVYR